jgi:PAS domain S-box-containing protein
MPRTASSEIAGTTQDASGRRDHALLDALPNLAWVRGPEGNVEYFNRPWREYTGATGPNVGMDWLAAVHPDDHARARATRQASIDRSEPAEIELRLREARTGRYRAHLCRVTPLRNELGEIEQWLGTAIDVDDIRQAQAALAASEARSRLALEAGELGAWEIDLATGRIQGNEQCRRNVGYPSEEAATLPVLLAHVHGSDRAALVRAIEHSNATGGPFSVTFRVHWPGQPVRWLSMRGGTTRDDAGRPVKMAGVTMDATPVKLREAEAIESRERLRAALDASGTGTFRWDIATNDLVWDENLDRLFGLAPGRTANSLGAFLAMVHPDDRQGILDACAACRDHGADFDMEFRVVWPDGSLHWLHDKGKTFRGTDGRPAYMTGACVDITPGKSAEQALRESEERFRQLADAMPQMVFAARPDGHVDYFNRQWYEYTGLPEGAIGFESWKHVHTEEGLRRVAEVWPEALRTGKPYEIEYRLRRKDGEYRWHLGRAMPVRDAAGRIVRWFGTNTDVHDFKLTRDALAVAREEAERASRAKDEFLAALSHELRTPLAPVLMATQLLEGEPGLSAEGRADLTMIRRNVEIETRLIDDLLDLTRVARGKIVLHRVPTDVHDVLRHAVETCRDDLFAEKRLRLVLDLAAASHWTLADAARLGQVFWNLVKNAVKFTPAGGGITVATRDLHTTDGRGIAVSVSDTGVGIDPAVLPTVFNAFEQGGPQVTRQFGGLGLGLAISKALAELHDGSIAAHSDGPGQGATFTVRLPTVDAPAVPDAAGPAASPANARRAAVVGRGRLLVVEDHEPTGRVLSRLLRGIGYDVHWASSAAAALAAAAEGPFDLVISDLGLPDSSGHELMRELRRLHQLRGVALTGYGSESDMARSAEAGFVAHLVKPVSMDALDDAIRQTLARGVSTSN